MNKVFGFGNEKQTDVKIKETDENKI